MANDSLNKKLALAVQNIAKQTILICSKPKTELTDRFSVFRAEQIDLQQLKFNNTTLKNKIFIILSI